MASDRDHILVEMRKTFAAIKENLLEEEPSLSKACANYSKEYLEKLVVLRAILGMRDPLITPVLDPRAPKGHIYPGIDEGSAQPTGDDITMLEDLADLGLLKRELHNHVNLCPHCRHCQINFRETCSSCGSIDIEIESMIHHFHCAYSGLESEFVSGIDLVCPKCRKRLNQLGQDFERPHDTYICRECDKLFEEPAINGQCLHCSHEFPGSDVEVSKIYRYRPTLLTVRAVELNRLTGLDVSEIMFDANVRFATREFLTIETEREIYRLNRYGGSLSTGILFFELHGRTYPIFRDWKPKAIQDLGGLLSTYHRTLDLLARLDNSRIGFLLPATDEKGLDGFKKRVVDKLLEMAFMSHCGKPLTPRWVEATWDGPNVSTEQILAFFDQQDACP